MKKTIYLLEDDEGIRDVITILLTEENYIVQSFKDVTEFMDRDRHKHADLFLLDVMLPDGNGIDVCTILKSQKETHYTPVLMMSANLNAQQISEACDAQAFLAKPFEINTLLDKIGSLLAN